MVTSYVYYFSFFGVNRIFFPIYFFFFFFSIGIFNVQYLLNIHWISIYTMSLCFDITAMWYFIFANQIGHVDEIALRKHVPTVIFEGVRTRGN